jgi:ParB family chromosome partitioning protein
MTKRRSLGRGLDALLSTTVNLDSDADRETGDKTELRQIPIELLERGQYQPRTDMREESLTELADSIRTQGVVQPIVVRPHASHSAGGEARFEIVAGERRWRAAQLAGLQTVPAVVKHISDHTALAIGLIENMQRENLNPVEEATSLRRLIAEFDMTHAEAADAVGRSRAAVSNLLRLLELPGPVRKLLEDRSLNMGHARAILGLPSTEKQIELAQRAAAESWSVRATEKAVRRFIANADTTVVSIQAALSRSKDPDIARLEADLSERLGAKVRVQHGPKGGRIEIRYHSLDELDGIMEHIR